MLYLSSMDRHNVQKINYLLKSWRKGVVAVSPWLRKQGVSRQLVDTYEKSAWIKPLGHGAYTRLDEKVDWTGGVYALQEQLNLPVHVGGRTALQMQGNAHFIPLGQGSPVFLFGRKRFLPVWFRQHPWQDPVRYVYTNCFPYKEGFGLTKQDMGTYAVTLSSREMAILEVLYLVGSKYETYEHAALLMEGLFTLRPALVQALLEKCCSIKVKRSFMYLAEHFNHPWVKHLNVSKVDLGKGKRVIAEGGQFDAKYQISVPKISS